MHRNISDIPMEVGYLIAWGIALIFGLAVIIAVGEILIAFASTGIGAIVLTIVGYKIWKKCKEENKI